MGMNVDRLGNLDTVFRCAMTDDPGHERRRHGPFRLPLGQNSKKNPELDKK